jgi:hypothetical protein
MSRYWQRGYYFCFWPYLYMLICSRRLEWHGNFARLLLLEMFKHDLQSRRMEMDMVNLFWDILYTIGNGSWHCTSVIYISGLCHSCAAMPVHKSFFFFFFLEACSFCVLTQMAALCSKMCHLKARDITWFTVLKEWRGQENKGVTGRHLMKEIYENGSFSAEFISDFIDVLLTYI